MNAGKILVLLTVLLLTGENRATAQELSIPEAHGGPVFVKFSPDGKTLASGCGGREIKLWEVATGKLRATLQASDDVYVINFTSDGKALNYAGVEVGQWDLSTGKKSVVYKCPGRFGTGALSRDGKLAAARRGPTIIVWELETGKKRATLREHVFAMIPPLMFSPDGQTLATVSGDKGDPGEVRLSDTTTGQEKAVLKGHDDIVTDIVFSADGKTLASSGLEGKVNLWEIPSLKLRRTLQMGTKDNPDSVLSLALSPDGKFLASGGEGDAVRLWDVSSGKQLAILQHANLVVSVAFSPDGRTFAAGCGNPFDLTPGRCEIKIWELAKILARKPLE
jgi:WD40 repeat protein